MAVKSKLYKQTSKQSLITFNITELNNARELHHELGAIINELKKKTNSDFKEVKKIGEKWYMQQKCLEQRNNKLKFHKIGVNQNSASQLKGFLLS